MRSCGKKKGGTEALANMVGGRRTAGWVSSYSDALNELNSNGWTHFEGVKEVFFSPPIWRHLLPTLLHRSETRLKC